MHRPAPSTRLREVVELARPVTRSLLLALCAATAGPAAGATTDERLLKLLRDKGVISQQEYGSLQGGTAAAPGLVDLLVRKGVLTPADAAGLTSQPAQGVAAAPAAPVFRGPFVLEDPAGGVEVEVNGRVHMDYRNFDVPVDGADNTFEVRRARLGATLSFAKHYEIEVTGDFSEEGAKLDTGYANFAWLKPAQLRVGKFKMPFSLEEMTSSNYIDFQERSLANAMAPGKLTGIMLHGAPAKGMYYGVAVSNGAEDLETDNNDGKDVIGRFAFDAGQLLGRKDTVIHLGLGASRGKLPAGESAPSVRSEGRGLKFFKARDFTGDDVDHHRLGTELALAYGPVKLQSEYVRAGFDGTSLAGAEFERDMSAWYASLSWMVSGENYADAYKKGGFSRIRPKSKFEPGKGKGAWELGLRYSRFDASDFSLGNTVGTGVLSSGYSNGADAWTLGLKWIPNDYSRLLVNWVRTSFDSAVDAGESDRNSEDAVTLRAQVNF